MSTEIMEDLKRKQRIIADAERKEAAKEGEINQIMASLKKLVGKEMTISEYEEYIELEREKNERRKIRAMEKYNTIKEKADVWGI